MDSSSLIPLIVAIVGSGGFLGGIYALLKLRPEAGQITVTAAQGAVIVQTGVIDTLREENDRAQNRIDALEAEMESVTKLRNRVETLENERDRLKAENGVLRDRVTHLEAELRKINGDA